jgi:hypothetical protein
MQPSISHGDGARVSSNVLYLAPWLNSRPCFPRIERASRIEPMQGSFTSPLEQLSATGVVGAT